MIDELIQRIKDLETLVMALTEENLALKDKVAKLEARLRGNSSNSSKPPSSDPPWKKKKSVPTNGKRGGQIGHVGVARELVDIENVDEIIRCSPAEICDCGGIVDVDKTASQRKQVFEIPSIKARVSEYQIFAGTCASCLKPFRGTLPAEVPAGMLGPNALATIGLLSGKYHLSKRDIQELFRDYFGLPLCAATVCNAEQQVSDALLTPYVELEVAIKQEKVVATDETSHPNSGKRGWMWVALTTMFAVFFAKPTRTKKSCQEILGEDFSGTVISDRYGAYEWLSNRQLCWAHLIRDFNKVADVGGESLRFASPVLLHIQRMFSVWHRFRDGEIARSQLKSEMKPICQKIEQALEIGQSVPGAEALSKNLSKKKPSLWKFIHEDGVEPTNNDAERTIRQYVIWRKTSFGSQGENGNKFMERILTAVATCKRQKRSVYEYLSTLMTARLNGQPAPSLLICHTR